MLVLIKPVFSYQVASLEFRFLEIGGTEATGQSNKKTPRQGSLKNTLNVNTSLRASRLNPKRAGNGLGEI